MHFTFTQIGFGDIQLNTIIIPIGHPPLQQILCIFCSYYANIMHKVKMVLLAVNSIHVYSGQKSSHLGRYLTFQKFHF